MEGESGPVSPWRRNRICLIHSSTVCPESSGGAAGRGVLTDGPLQRGLSALSFPTQNVPERVLKNLFSTKNTFMPTYAYIYMHMYKTFKYTLLYIRCMNIFKLYLKYNWNSLAQRK